MSPLDRLLYHTFQCYILKNIGGGEFSLSAIVFFSVDAGDDASPQCICPLLIP